MSYDHMFTMAIKCIPLFFDALQQSLEQCPKKRSRSESVVHSKLFIVSMISFTSVPNVVVLVAAAGTLDLFCLDLVHSQHKE